LFGGTQVTRPKPRAPAGKGVPAGSESASIQTPDAPPPPRHSGPRRGTRAVRAAQAAERLEQREPYDWTDRVLKAGEARRSREEAQRLLAPDRELVRGGGEVAQRADGDRPWDSRRANLVDTLEHPNMITVEASEQRTSDLMHVDILAPGLDAVVTAGATNSLEKMLCHQVAAAHHVAMRMLGDAVGPIALRPMEPVEQVRLANAAARMMDVFQAGLLTLQRLRTGGRQEVVVQHVQVNEGGQAVVAGSIKTQKRRGAKRGRR
jgi:hypothetical protein